MNYITALEASKLVEEIEKNNSDMRILEDATRNDIVGAQITIACKMVLIQLLFMKMTE